MNCSITNTNRSPLVLQSATSNVSLENSVASPCFPNINLTIEADESEIRSSFSNGDWSPSNSDSSDIPITELITLLSRSEEEIYLFQKGYEFINKICDTLQGELFKAEVVTNDKNVEIGSYVAVKKVPIECTKNHIAIEDGMRFCVAESIVKEAMILKHLTVDSKTTMSHQYVVKFVDFFMSDSDYYLITEYIANSVTLEEFIIQSMQLMRDNKLKSKKYLKSIKFIMWQLACITRWLHKVYQCCHLDLSISNILIQNDSMSVTLVDFGVSELFKKTKDAIDKPFKCCKQGLSINNMCHMSPQIINQNQYDAKVADMWSIGSILYKCITGQSLFVADDIIWADSSNKNGYDAVMTDSLRKYLVMNNLHKRCSPNSLSLLKGLLSVDENKRITAEQMLIHPWFKLYYKRYQNILDVEINSDLKICTLKKIQNMHQLAFYLNMN